MSTPFFVVDHKVGPHDPHPVEEKRVIRRGAPAPLQITLPSAGTPLLYRPSLAAPAPLAAHKGPSSRGSWLSRLFRGLRHAPA